METGYLLLGVGIMTMTLAYGLFTGAQYFSPVYMLFLLALPVVSVILLLLSYYMKTREPVRGRKGDTRTGLALILTGIAVLVIAAEANFVAYSTPETLQNSVRTGGFVVALALEAALLTYVISVSSVKKKTLLFNILFIICIVTSSVAFAKLQMIGTLGPSLPVGTDELAVQYYAAGAFLAGNNPYAMNFRQTMYGSGVSPALYLNGSCVCTLTYPALSFVMLTPIAAFVTNYPGFLLYALAISTAALLTVLVLLFKVSGNNRMMLVPAFAISLAMFWITPWALAKNVVMLLLMLAYIYRKNTYMYPALLGVAASMHQLSWVMLPFFMLLTFSESGFKRALKVGVAAFAIFLALNSYFIYLSGGAVLKAFLSAPGTWLLPRGLNIMQYLIAFYPVRYDLLVPFALMIYVFLLVVFYLKKSVRPLMGVATSIVFLFSTWSSLSYILPSMPILASMLAERKAEGKASAEPDKKLAMVFAVAIGITLFAFFFQVLTSHTAYVQNKPVSIVQAIPVIQNNSAGTQSLPSILAKLNITARNLTNVTFYIVSIRPATLRQTLIGVQRPNSIVFNMNATLVMGLNNVTNSTKVKVFASADHYITTT